MPIDYSGPTPSIPNLQDLNSTNIRRAGYGLVRLGSRSGQANGLLAIKKIPG